MTREEPTFYTLRDDAPPWAYDMWPGEDGEPMSVYDLPPAMAQPEDWARNVCDAWVLWRSIDHGLRAADETMVLEIAELAYLILAPVLDAMARWSGYSVDRLDAYAAVCEALDYSGDGWCEPIDDDPNSERIGWAHDEYVFYRQHDAVPTVLVETSPDAGMTWILVRDGGWNR